MNFLAHILLSRDSEDLLIGNFIADFIRNKEVGDYSAEIQKGIHLHRLIDSFTDQHEQVRKGSRRLMKNHGKYAPVVIDILYDNVLAANWSKYHGDSLDDFAVDTYEILQRRIMDLPLKLQSRVPLMVADDFLIRYGTDEGLQYALSMMDRRTKFPSNFVLASAQLKEEWELFENEFNIFFPEVFEMAVDFCDS